MQITDAKRIVIKTGSALITDQQTGALKEAWLMSLAKDVAYLLSQDKEVTIVSSGSVALGRKYLGLERKVLRLEEQQAAAACGQVELLRHYRRVFEKESLKTAQILLTFKDTEDRRRYLNAKNTMMTLLGNRIVPVVNENDTVATNELRFGDNDRLAAKVAQMVSADLLILLSDIDGLYTENPKLNSDAEFVSEVKEITPEIERMATGSLSFVGSGGMVTKIAAAKIATKGGCNVVLSDGNTKRPIDALIKGGKATWFLSGENPLNARKHWIATSLHVQGEIIVDKGAVRALQEGNNSLLPAGVIDVKGSFSRGDAVIIKDCSMVEIGKGLTAYSSKDAKLIMGQQSVEIKNIVGFSGRDELIHKDDLVLSK